MKNVKVSYIYGHEDFKHLLIPKIIASYFNINLIWTTPEKCDLLFVGPYEKYKKIKTKLTNSLNIFFQKLIYEYERKLIFRKIKPITVFYSRENERIFDFHENFKIGTDYNYANYENYFRIPVWKDFIDWTGFNLIKSPNKTLNSIRYGDHYNLEDMIKPQGTNFIKKKKHFCCFFSYLTEPRKSLINLISKKFQIQGYGKAFDKNIESHNKSYFLKKNILTNYFANFCPENTLYPGWYTEKVPDAFLAKTLPVTWSDQNIKNDFNKNCFINLNDYHHNEIDNILNEMKSDSFLMQFAKEPLLLKKPNLDNEINFAKKIIKNFI